MASLLICNPECEDTFVANCMQIDGGFLLKLHPLIINNFLSTIHNSSACFVKTASFSFLPK